MAIAVKVLSILLGAFFIMAGSTKLMGMAPHPEHFAEWGYPQWFRLFVGAWETAFGALFMIPSMAKLAGGALALGMAGAIVTAVTRGPAPAQALFPLFLLLLVGFVTRSRIRARP